MTHRRPPNIPLRRQIFVGCEGKSEAGYVALLQDFARTASLPIYLNIKELAPGAGDPLARVEMAVRLIKQESATRIAPSASFVLLDEDQTVLAPARAETARQLATQKNITIVWQRPCFEAVLLRHLLGCHTRRPPDTTGAGNALQGEWPEYAKPMDRAALARRLDLAGAMRAAGVEPELAALLRAIGLLT
jgi:hypothetical protein